MEQRFIVPSSSLSSRDIQQSGKINPENGCRKDNRNDKTENSDSDEDPLDWKLMLKMATMFQISKKYTTAAKVPI